MLERGVGMTVGEGVIKEPKERLDESLTWGSQSSWPAAASLSRADGTSTPVLLFLKSNFSSLNVPTFRILSSQNRLIAVLQMAFQGRTQTVCN